jgi:hypothetical protein
MALELKVSVKREIDRLRKELTAATARLATLQDEIKRHELIYDMLDGKTKRSNQPKGGNRPGRPRGSGGAQKRGPSGSMIDWKAVFETLPNQFTLDTIGANKTASEKPRAYLRQVVVRWSKEGRIKRTGRGMYQKT